PPCRRAYRARLRGPPRPPRPAPRGRPGPPLRPPGRDHRRPALSPDAGRVDRDRPSRRAGLSPGGALARPGAERGPHPARPPHPGRAGGGPGRGHLGGGPADPAGPPDRDPAGRLRHRAGGRPDRPGGGECGQPPVGPDPGPPPGRLGGATVATRLSALTVVPHLAVGALLWGTMVALVCHADRFAGTAGRDPAEPEPAPARTAGQAVQAYFLLTKRRS